MPQTPRPPSPVKDPGRRAPPEKDPPGKKIPERDPTPQSPPKSAPTDPDTEKQREIRLAALFKNASGPWKPLKVVTLYGNP